MLTDTDRDRNGASEVTGGTAESEAIAADVGDSTGEDDDEHGLDEEDDDSDGAGDDDDADVKAIGPMPQGTGRRSKLSLVPKKTRLFS